MPLSLILDASVLLFDPQAILRFPEQSLYLPLSALAELDRARRAQPETARNARLAATLIDGLRQRGPLRFGVLLDNGATLTVVQDEPQGRHPALELARAMAANAAPDTQLRLVTRDVATRLRADALGIDATDYRPEATLGTDDIRGWHLLDAEPTHLEAIRQGLDLDASPHLAWQPNDYAILRDRTRQSAAVPARFDHQTARLRPLRPLPRSVCGISPLNLEQTLALDALLDESISLVTLAGRAGTGKTLLAIAAGLHQVFAGGPYTKLLVFRPTMPVSRDLGYLPGDLGDKMRPWMQPVTDALEFIRQQDRRSPARTLPDDLLAAPEISVETLTYIRGRSIPNQFIVIDETQNLTPLEVKTAITRCGRGTKVVLTGDPDQIDTPLLDAFTNGLARTVQKFHPSPLAAHITLQRGERSELAEAAAQLLD